MDSIYTAPLSSSTSSGGALSGSEASSSLTGLGSDDFLKLLIMQLRNQDPLEPMDNSEMLQQIASIRDIELSTTLTASLRTLTGQQRFASASSLIGQHVTGVASEDGSALSGVVVGVRFTSDGSPILQLSNGRELPVDQVSTIESPLRAAEALLGQGVVGIDGRDPSRPEVVDGVVTGVRLDAQGEVVLELDTGQDLRFRDVASVTAVETI